MKINIYNIFPVGIIKYIIDNHLIDNNNSIF